jgi:HEAT repeat protein
MKYALWVLAAAMPLAGQPKLLVNANMDTRSAASGLDGVFRALLTSQPQPAWIGYEVPSVRSYNLGCEYVFRDGQAPQGVVHLEPPDHAVILIRVDQNAVTRIRAISPDCQIDAGGFPVHWLTDVQPAQSVALLASFALEREPGMNGAISALAMHSDASADQALDRLLAPSQPQSIRLRVVSAMGSDRGRHGFEVLKGLIANDTDERVRERAINALASSKEPGAVDLLLETARKNPNPKLRAQAVSDLARKSGRNVLPTLKEVIENDPDITVQRRAISVLNSLPDGEGIPLLIELVKTEKRSELRKQAMNALQNSRDPRAIAFFEAVLK